MYVWKELDSLKKAIDILLNNIDVKLKYELSKIFKNIDRIFYNIEIFFMNLRNRYWIIIITLSIVFVYSLENKFNSGDILKFENISNYAVAEGTILLAFFTWRLATVTKEQSKEDREQRQREWTKSQIKEKLNFYLPLMGEIRQLGDMKIPYPALWLIDILEKYDVQSKFELYADEYLRKNLLEYYYSIAYLSSNEHDR